MVPANSIRALIRRLEPLREFCDVKLAYLLIILMAPSWASALSRFDADRAEWASFPAYCRAKYSQDSNTTSEWYWGSVPAKEIDYWKATLGRASWAAVHHYCWSLLNLRTAKKLRVGKDYGFMLNQAIVEANYFFPRLDPDDYLWPEMAVHIAHVYQLQGKRDQAIELLQQVIFSRPAYSKAYSLMAIMLRKAGDLDGALAVLQLGANAEGERDAEFHYIYGHVLVDREEFESAVDHAKKAYALGYPLPGLKRKLKRRGHWQD